MVGDTPNIAARLQGIAEPGAVIVAASTRELLGDLFRISQPRLPPGQGHQRTDRGVGGRRRSDLGEPLRGGAHARARAGFVGRKAEIEFALSRQQLAWQGQGQAVLISGEAGIGKSRLVAMLCENPALGPHCRVRYQCSPYHTNSALHPFIAQLERAAGIGSQDPSEQKLDKLETMLAFGTQQVTNARR